MEKETSNSVALSGGKSIPRSATLVVIGNRAFRSLWLGQICSQLALSMTMFVLALSIYQTTGSSTAVSGLFLAFAVPGLLFGMMAGAVVDHFDKRSVLVIADLVRAVLALSFLLYLQYLPAVYLTAFFMAWLTQFYGPAEAPMIPKLVPPAQLVTANSLFSFTFYSSVALGAMLAGPLLRFLGPYSVFGVISSLFLLALWHDSQIPAEKGKKELSSIRYLPSVFYAASRVLSLVQEGWRYVTQSEVLVDALLLLTGTQIIIAVLGTLGPGFADRVLEIDIHDASLVIIGPVVAGIVTGALWVGNIGYRLGSSRLIRVGITAAGLILIFISITVRLKRVSALSFLFIDPIIFPVELLLFFLLGFANSMLDVPANSILQKEARGPMRGRVYGILTAAVSGVGILPVVVSGILADTIGVGKVIFLLGLTITGYGLYRMKYNVGK